VGRRNLSIAPDFKDTADGRAQGKGWKKHMETFFIVFFFWMAVLLLSLVPVWLLLIPPSLSFLLCIRLWKQRRLRNASLVLCFLTVMPLGVSVSEALCGKVSLKMCFGSAVPASSVVRYRFSMARIGEMRHYWELEDIDASKGHAVVQQIDLQPVEAGESLSSAFSPPDWWPTSSEGYTRFEGRDSSGGATEFWQAEISSKAYLFRFME